MSLEQFNFFGYRITDNKNAEQANNVTAAFCYRGFEVAFNTFATAGMKVAVYRDGSLVGEYASVEASIAACDEMIEWRKGTKGVRLPVHGWQSRRAG